MRHSLVMVNLMGVFTLFSILNDLSANWLVIGVMIRMGNFSF